MIGRGKDDKNGKPRYWCRCDCGNRKLLYGADLVEKKRKSCGCSNRGVVQVPKNKYKCVETGEIFDSSIKAAKFAGVKNGWQIIYACDGRLKSTGLNPETGEKFHWEFVPCIKDKFIGTVKGREHRLYCVNTGKRYYSPCQAARSLGYSNRMGGYIKEVCDCYRLSAGKDPETGEKLLWEWI